MEGDEHGWLQLDADSGELKTKAALDREKLEELNIKIIAYETGETTVAHNTVLQSISRNIVSVILCCMFFNLFQRETSRSLR